MNQVIKAVYNKHQTLSAGAGSLKETPLTNISFFKSVKLVWYNETYDLSRTIWLMYNKCKSRRTFKVTDVIMHANAYYDFYKTVQYELGVYTHYCHTQGDRIISVCRAVKSVNWCVCLYIHKAIRQKTKKRLREISVLSFAKQQ